MKLIKKYTKVWFLLSTNITQLVLTSRLGAVTFIFGKLIRFTSFLFFLWIIGSRTKLVSGYTLWQMILFFLTYNLIDIIAQLFLREVYRFRNYVVKGDFDYFLTKPFSPLFRSLFGGIDVTDLPLFVFSLIGVIIAGYHIQGITLYSIFFYIILVGNALVIALAFHILVLAIGVVTTEVDNMIMLYRDITQMGRVPIDFYTQPIRSILTFIIPVGIMMTVPAKALIGTLSIQIILASFIISILGLVISLWLWKKALANYSSASS